MTAAQSIRAEGHQSVNQEHLQRVKVLAELGTIADTGTMEVDVTGVYSDLEADMVPDVSMYVHDVSYDSSAAATRAVSTGDSVAFNVTAPNLAELDDSLEEGPIKIVHTFGDGITDGAATPAELVADFNASPHLSKYVYATLLDGTVNAVALVPKDQSGSIILDGGAEENTPAAVTALGFPAAIADRKQATYTRIGSGTGSMAYDAGTKTVTFTNATAARDRLVMVARFF